MFKKNTKKNTGFTLLEILLSVTILAIIVGVGAPIYVSFKDKNDLNVSAQTIVQTLRRAQILSQAAAQDTTWGVYLADQSITLFAGSDFDTRDTTFDETINLPNTLSISGLNEIFFEKISGVPNLDGTINLISNNETQTITINSLGTLSF